MQHDPPQGNCPEFAAVVRAALPANSCSQGPGLRARFLDDVARPYKSPIVKIDIEDLEVVFRGVRSPSLGVGTASARAGRSGRRSKPSVRQAAALLRTR